MKHLPIFAGLLFLGLTLWPTVCGAVSRISAEQILKSGGYKTDSASLIEYLESGISVDIVKAAERRFGPLNHSHYRWGHYSPIIAQLGVLSANDAIPVLMNILEGNLPRPLEADLREIESSGVSSRWQGAIFERTELRVACAWSLAAIGHDDARDAVYDLVKDIARIVGTYKDDDVSSWTRLYVQACRTLAEFRDRRGIDELITAYDWKLDAGTISRALRTLTGCSFGPDSTYPPHRYSVEIQRWRDWWKANREAWQEPFERREELHRVVVPIPYLPRDYLLIMVETNAAGYSFDGISWELNVRRQQRAREWLEEHGRRHAREFRRIAMDEDERYPIRGEALAWYARFGGRGAGKLVQEYANTTEWQDEGESGAILWIQRRAKKLYWQYIAGNR